jgi:hypothetical protein
VLVPVFPGCQSNFVFIQLMIATPVIYKHNRVATYRWRMTATATKVIPKFRSRMLWDKPDAGLATHPI